MVDFSQTDFFRQVRERVEGKEDIILRYLGDKVILDAFIGLVKFGYIQAPQWRRKLKKTLKRYSQLMKSVPEDFHKDAQKFWRSGLVKTGRFLSRVERLKGENLVNQGVYRLDVGALEREVLNNRGEQYLDAIRRSGREYFQTLLDFSKENFSDPYIRTFFITFLSIETGMSFT